MTKSELQSALAGAAQTDKKTAGVFLETLSALAYKEIKKNGEFVLPGFGKLVKQKRKARTGFNPKLNENSRSPRDATEDQDSSQDRRQIPSRQGGKGRGSGGKEVDQLLLLFVLSVSGPFRLLCIHACRKSESSQS